MNQLNLNLIPTHPDQAGGLAFVGEAQRFFGIVLLAYSISVAGVLANSVIYDKIPLPQFAPSIAIYVVLAVLLILVPMGIFTGRLLKRNGRVCINMVLWRRSTPHPFSRNGLLRSRLEKSHYSAQLISNRSPTLETASASLKK
jgi:hypothetical protein